MALADIPVFKRCTKCGETKPLEAFNKAATGVDGRRGDCAACRRSYNRRWYADLGDDGKTARYLKNREASSEYLKSWLAENIDRKREYARRAIRKARATPQGKLQSNIARAVNYALRNNKRGASTFALLGYTIDDLVRHLERQFQPGMCWDNYGPRGWHVDHIRPLCSFIFQAPDDPQFREAWALANLRPLWARDNLKKGGRIVLLT